MIADLLGWTGLIFAALVTLLLAYRQKKVALILGIAFTVRLVAVLFHYYVAPLPDGTTDAVGFERYAWQWAQGGFVAALGNYPGIDAYFYSWLMSLLYAITARSLLMLQSLSLLIGILGVYATYQLARELWGCRTACKAAWLMALFPTVVQYSALPMREAYVVLFFVLGLIFVVRWSRQGGILPIIGGLLAFFVSTFFHGGMFVAALAFLMLVAWRSLKELFSALYRRRLKVTTAIVLVIALGTFVLYVTSGVSIQKLGTAAEMVSAERWFHYFETRDIGGAKYPEWTQPHVAVDFIWAVPLRAVYLLFSPFPWDLRRSVQFIGFLDGLFYFTFILVIWRHRRNILTDPAARSILFILIGLILAFGVGTGNFGTALRHRAKFVAGLIVLASYGLTFLRIGTKPPRLSSNSE